MFHLLLIRMCKGWLAVTRGRVALSEKREDNFKSSLGEEIYIFRKKLEKKGKRKFKMSFH